jgi:ketosteroid isomerase-like protein
MQRGTVWMGRVMATALIVAACASAPARAQSPEIGRLQEELRARETAFAKTMADRDHAAFASFIADEAVFFGGQGELRGKKAVVEAWARFYAGKEAPFSWRPESVSVLDSGTLGLSSGPVFDPAGKQIGTFSSIWRRTPDGTWEIIFDKGCPYCPEQ